MVTNTSLAISSPLHAADGTSAQHGPHGCTVPMWRRGVSATGETLLKQDRQLNGETLREASHAQRRPSAVAELKRSSDLSIRAAPAPWPMPQHEDRLSVPDVPVRSAVSAASADGDDASQGAGHSGKRDKSIHSGKVLGPGTRDAGRGSRHHPRRILSSDGSLGSFMRLEAAAAADLVGYSPASSTVRSPVMAETPATARAASSADSAPPSASEVPGLCHSNGAASVASEQHVGKDCMPEALPDRGARSSSTGRHGESWMPNLQSILSAGTAQELQPSGAEELPRADRASCEGAEPDLGGIPAAISRVLDAQIRQPPIIAERQNAMPDDRADQPAAAPDSSAFATDAVSLQQPDAGEFGVPGRQFL